MAYGASELDQSDTASTGLGFGIKITTDNYAVGMSFVPGKTGKLDYAIFQCTKNGTPTGNIACKLYADDGTSPTGSALSTSSNVDVSTIGTDQDITFQFPDDYHMAGGTKYWLVLEVTYAESNANYISVAIANANNYASGNRNRMNSVNVWLDDQGTNDMYFKEYILPYTAEVAGFASYLEV